MQPTTPEACIADHWLQHSERVFSASEVDAAIDNMVSRIQALPEIGQSLVLMCVMRGGLYLSGQLLAKLPLAAKVDYLQANRYNGLQGAGIAWSKKPELDLQGQTVLVIDDILDEGVTLAEVVQFCREAGAKHVYSAVLTEKDNGIHKPLQADVVGLTVPNAYVFGCGMDVYGWWRNLPEIRALTTSPT